MCDRPAYTLTEVEPSAIDTLFLEYLWTDSLNAQPTLDIASDIVRIDVPA